ncbi:hypothetical protein PHISP_00915 [Aspergillus sp. HF37]|nr:hypothetical protein PHISP_00915 [Aspergillus sp. HF37]
MIRQFVFSSETSRSEFQWTGACQINRLDKAFGIQLFFLMGAIGDTLVTVNHGLHRRNRWFRDASPRKLSDYENAWGWNNQRRHLGSCTLYQKTHSIWPVPLGEHQVWTDDNAKNMYLYGLCASGQKVRRTQDLSVLNQAVALERSPAGALHGKTARLEPHTSNGHENHPGSAAQPGHVQEK